MEKQPIKKNRIKAILIDVGGVLALGEGSKLKKQGYKVAVLSDQWFLSKEALMPEKLYKNFDEIMVSCDVEIRKPNKKIYQLSVKKLNFSPKEILFIDNQKWNILPAKKLGMNTILFKSNKQLFSDEKWRNL